MVKYGILPTTLYRVKVPIISTYSDIEMEIYGLPVQETTTGVTDCLDEEMCLVMLPLTTIIDIYSTGARILLVDRSKLTEIYNILEKYLQNTTDGVYQLNSIKNTDTRDVDIDRFASELFDLNRVDIVNNTFNKKSGFDIGIGKLDIPTRANLQPVNGRINVTDAYKTENDVNAVVKQDVYLTHNTNIVNPDKVIRTPKIHKRKRLKPKEL